MIVAGVLAGAGGGALATCSLCAIAEIAAERTAVAGIESSTWTPLTGAATLIAGESGFAGSFELGPILLGAVLFGAAWIGIGLAVAAAVRYLLGSSPDGIGGALIGAAGGAFALILLLPLLVNGLLQDTLYTYRSLPPWGWWIGFITAGALTGALAARGIALAGEEDPHPELPKVESRAA